MVLDVAKIISWSSGEVLNAFDPTKAPPQSLATAITQIAPLGREAVAGAVSFFFDPHYTSALAESSPTLLVISRKLKAALASQPMTSLAKTLIFVSDDPQGLMSRVGEHFAKSDLAHAHLERRTETSVHPGASIDRTARVGKDVSIAAGVTVERGAVLGDGVVLYPGVYVGPGVAIGDDSVLFPNVVVYERCLIGKRVRLHAGVVIGADGFGYAPLVRSGRPVGHQKIYHLGTVEIGDDVEIGANSCVDRATMGRTLIGPHVKIDNMVQIGHNCEVGEGSILCGKVGLSGSARVGRYVYIGGATGINNKVTIGDGARIGGYSVAVHDVPAGQILWGIPGRLGRDTFRIQVLLDRLLKNGDKNERPEPEAPHGNA